MKFDDLKELGTESAVKVDTCSLDILSHGYERLHLPCIATQVNMQLLFFFFSFVFYLFFFYFFFFFCGDGVSIVVPFVLCATLIGV
jgi:hypothetical protein